ncbi:MAG: hypothetical protein D6791_12630 [Chloroflexi bacterium]|nr:MAG: hypothetical protein D6791_12630 [Chloroflexota bacterium]
MRKMISLAALALIVAFGAGFLLTATGAIAAPQQPLRYVQIVGEVFLDTAGHNYNLPCPGCNGYWDNADWCGELYTPLPPVTLILRDAETNEEIARKTARKNPNNGRQWAYFSVPARDAGFVLEVEAVPEGFESCPTSPLSRLLTPYDLRYGHRLVRFYFWWGCPAVPPGAGPPPPPPGNGTNYYYGCGVFPIVGHTQP